MSVDYAAVLADLRARREKLDIAIRAIEEIATLGGADLSATSGTIRPDSFFGMQVLDAAIKYLKMAKAPKPASDIANALEMGGLTHQSKNFASTVYTTLSRDEDRGGEMVKVGQNWGLAEWYPGRRKNARAVTVPPGVDVAVGKLSDAFRDSPAFDGSVADAAANMASLRSGGGDIDPDDLPFE